ncbi:MAG: transposase [Bacteroidales bacterium]
MEKKDFYRRHLPHFQQPGQEYFVTWCIKDAVPARALEIYTIQLDEISQHIETSKRNNADEQIISELKMEFSRVRRKYMKAFDDLLHLQTEFIVNLSKYENTEIVINALCFWEGKRLENYAICVMSNHVHWVFRVFEKDENGEPVYLQDIMQSVKRFSANKINKIENRVGSVWHNESYDTTIRDQVHLFNAINYTIENPVSAGLVENWWDWKGTKLFLT